MLQVGYDELPVLPWIVCRGAINQVPNLAVATQSGLGVSGIAACETTFLLPPKSFSYDGSKVATTVRVEYEDRFFIKYVTCKDLIRIEKIERDVKAIGYAGRKDSCI